MLVSNFAIEHMLLLGCRLEKRQWKQKREGERSPKMRKLNILKISESLVATNVRFNFFVIIRPDIKMG